MNAAELLAGLDQRLADAGLSHWLPGVPDACAAALEPSRHGSLATWLAALATLPGRQPSSSDVAQAAVTIGAAADLDRQEAALLHAALETLMPWRKGPFSMFGIDIDAEWRSDLKWQRIEQAGIDFRGARVLDVGCGNGYYAWRMLGAGAARVIGIDPTLLHRMQFAVCQHYLQDRRVDILPLPFEALPEGRRSFDVVCSMGVLYHRRSPLDHLSALIRELAEGGTLVLETIVVPGDVDTVLCPSDRYARMRNVWMVPSSALTLRWLERLGMRARVVHEGPTTVAEQRPTAWMNFESLAHALDPQDPTRTVEGHPAPGRALIVASRAPA